MDLYSACVYGAGAGVVSHLGYFIHGEHITETLRIVLVFTSTTFVIFFLQLGLGQSYIAAITYTTAVVTTYLVSLFSSITIYRIFFHRLRSFPGPFAAKVSKIWQSYHALPDFQNYLLMEKMYKQYGDFVRIGPNEIAIFDPESIGICSKIEKGPWFDSTLPLVSLQTIRDLKFHAQRRRLWDKGFSTKGWPIEFAHITMIIC